MHRTPDRALSIGLAVEGKPVVGVIYNPIRDELFSARLGGGAWLNGKQIRVDAIAEVCITMIMIMIIIIIIIIIMIIIAAHPIFTPTHRQDLNHAIIYSNLGYGRDDIAITHMLGTMDRVMRRGLRAMRFCGSACISLTTVACGLSSAYYESGPHAWDVCAGAIIVKEAGGVVLDMTGAPLDLCSRCYLAASSQKLADEIIACVVHPMPYGRK